MDALITPCPSSHLAPPHPQLERWEERWIEVQKTTPPTLFLTCDPLLFCHLPYMLHCCPLHVGYEAYGQVALSSALPTPRKENWSPNVLSFAAQLLMIDLHTEVGRIVISTHLWGQWTQNNPLTKTTRKLFVSVGSLDLSFWFSESLLACLCCFWQ